MHATPTKRQERMPEPPATPDPSDPRCQMERMTPQHLRDALSSVPKNIRMNVSTGYRSGAGLGSPPPVRRTPLGASRSEPNIHPGGAIFQSAQEVLQQVVWDGSPSRALAPMCDILCATDPWSSPSKLAQLSCGGGSLRTGVASTGVPATGVSLQLQLQMQAQGWGQSPRRAGKRAAEPASASQQQQVSADGVAGQEDEDEGMLTDEDDSPATFPTAWRAPSAMASGLMGAMETDAASSGPAPQSTALGGRPLRALPTRAANARPHRAGLAKTQSLPPDAFMAQDGF